MRQSAETLREKRRAYQKRMKEFTKHPLPKSRIMWDKQLPNGKFLGLFYPAINLKRKRVYMAVIHERPIKGFVGVCQIDENGSIIKSYKDITSIDGLIKILVSQELKAILAIDQLYAS